jgi:YrbI family 3-deoxy-D-manno-octulosonate 8-phosphate phosphatase
MAIIHLTKSNFQVGIISSGFKGVAVQKRAEMLGIQHCTVNRAPKMETLKEICDALSIGLENVAMIGDDINDLEVMKNCGIAVCPKNAVGSVKNEADIILSLNGGEGCVREFIDQYLLKAPLN